jgi:hypothetical protein
MREYCVVRTPCCLSMNFHPKKTDLVLASRALLGSNSIEPCELLRAILAQRAKGLSNYL